MIKLKIILGSTRPNRFNGKAGQWIFEIADKKEGVEVELLDLRDWPLPFFNEPMPPSMIQNGAYSTEIVREWAKKIKEANAFIIVSPEYNHGISGVLKNALDAVYAEWNKKPVAFVAYGSVGGARAVEHLRSIAIELQMVPIRNSVHIREPWNLVDSNGNLKEGALDQYNDAANAMIDQLLEWTEALKRVF